MWRHLVSCTHGVAAAVEVAIVEVVDIVAIIVGDTVVATTGITIVVDVGVTIAATVAEVAVDGRTPTGEITGIRETIVTETMR